MNGKKVLITGSNGMLGSELIKKLTKENILSFDPKLDIVDFKAVYTKLNVEKPDIIIHAAAYTNVDSCEINTDKAYQINAIGTQNLVNYCIDKDVLFIYISSTGIYGTSKNTRYTEYDNVNPTTIHHKTKYEGEKIVQNHLNKYLIIRTGWLYGGNITHSKNFVYKRYLESKNKDIVYSDDSQIGNPTYVIDLIDQIKILIDNNQYGIFNCINEAKNISRYDYVKQIVELFDIECNVNIAPQNMFTRIAPVSNNESAINYKLNLLNINVMGDWNVSLYNYVKQLKGEIDG